MKRNILKAACAAIAIIAIVSCEDRIVVPEVIPSLPVDKAGIVFTATTETAAATKTALSENGGNFDVVWRNGDQITIVDGESHVGKYTTTSTTTTADFTYIPESGAEATASPYKAWYPASLYNGGTPTLPATQNYVEENISGAPMYAESSTTTLNFKNICGIIRLNISTTQDGKKVRKIVLSADQGMSGPISNVTSFSSESPIAATVSGITGVTLDCGTSGVAINGTATPFYITVPANSYTTLKITVITTDGFVQTRTSNKAITVARSQITDLTLPFNSFIIGNLVQYWPFDGNANNDISGGVNAVVSGATLTTDRFGNENSAYYFDGNDKMTASGAANFGTTSFTANIWACSTQTTGYGNLMRTDGGYYNGWLLRFNSGKIEIWEGRTDNRSYVSKTSYANGIWHMVTFVRDVENRLGKLYVDGIYIGSYSMATGTNNVTNPLRFGTYDDGEYYVGKMDDARLYNKALTDAEILALYNL